MPDLKDFTDATARTFGFQTTDDPRRLRTAEQIAEDEAASYADVDDELEPTEDDDEDPRAAAFLDSLSTADRAAAERSPTVRDGLWAAWVADQAAAGAGDDDEDADPDNDVPQTPAEFVAYAYGRESEILKAGWESVDAFLIHCASDVRWWLAEAVEQGWPVEARPGERDLPPSLAMRVVAAGVPGAKIVPDRLHRPLNRWR